jgi:hypothetical protein
MQVWTNAKSQGQNVVNIYFEGTVLSSAARQFFQDCRSRDSYVLMAFRRQIHHLAEKGGGPEGVWANGR